MDTSNKKIEPLDNLSMKEFTFKQKKLDENAKRLFFPSFHNNTVDLNLSKVETMGHTSDYKPDFLQVTVGENK